MLKCLSFVISPVNILDAVLQPRGCVICKTYVIAVFLVMFVLFMCIFGGTDFSSDLCCSRMEKFDAARKSYGTDEDTLFVYKDGIS